MKMLEGKTVEEAIITGDSEDISNIVEDIDTQINSMTSEFGADKMDAEFSIKVYRVIEGKGELSWLFACVPSELPIMQKLQDDYGGGRFEIRIYKNKKIFRRIPVAVSPPIKNKEPEKPVQNDLTALVNAISSQQERQFNQLKETLLQIAGRQTSPAPDPMALMGAMMGALVQMKQFISPTIPASSVSPDKMIEVLIKGMELGREAGGGGETNFLDIAKEAMKNLPHLAALASMQPSQQVQQISPPKKVATLANLKKEPALTNTETSEVNKMNAVIKHNLNMLVQKAELGSDPVLYAEFILDNVPEETIKQYILRDDLIEEMTKFNPKVLEHKNWFLELRNHIHAVLTGEGEETDNSTDDANLSGNIDGNPTGDGGDAPNS